MFTLFFLFCNNVSKVDEDCPQEDDECSIELIEVNETDNINSNDIFDEPVKVYFFSEPGCDYCDKIENFLKNNFTNQTKVNIDFEVYSMINSRNMLASLEELLDIKIKGSPVLIIQDEVLSGVEEINNNYISKIIEKAKLNPDERTDIISQIDKESGKEKTVESFLNYNILVVIGSGLLDGINPCAFATIIFLLSYLSYVGRTKKETLIIGIIYSLAVFSTYFIVGIGFYKIIDSFTAYSIISDIIKIISIVLVTVLAIGTFIDFLKAKKGNFGDMNLTLSDNMKRRIHSIIRNKLKLRGIVISSLIIGIVVSFFELACTGQVYLPTILYILGEGSINNIVRSRAFIYLLIYNIAFIIPLLIIFLITYFGVSSKAMQKYLQKRTVLIKFLLFLLFIGLGLYMMLTYFIL